MNTKVDEGKLISGKEALIALGRGEDVEFKDGMDKWENVKHHMNLDLSMFLTSLDWMKFRLKPRTITINGIEVPAPFKPKDGDKYYYIDTNRKIGYDWDNYDCETTDENRATFGAWQTEEEAQQVVSALRQVFGGSHDN